LICWIESVARPEMFGSNALRLRRYCARADCVCSCESSRPRLCRIPRSIASRIEIFRTSGVTLSSLALPLNTLTGGVWKVVCGAVELFWSVLAAEYGLCPGACALTGNADNAMRQIKKNHKPADAGVFVITTFSSNSWRLDACIPWTKVHPDDADNFVLIFTLRRVKNRLF